MPNWIPNKGRQQQAFDCDAFEILYGGAAGGGKSELLLGVARKKHKRGVLLRRTYGQLEESLILRSMEIYGDRAWYNASKYVWNFPDGGRIKFGHMENNKAVQNYQGAAYDLVGFDELTQFTEFQYEYLISRMRTVVDGVKTQIISTTNPGGEGNDWVMKRWGPWLDESCDNPAEPGELRYYKRDKAGNMVETTADDPLGKSRTFIPAFLDDNPYYGEEYRSNLELMPEPLRSQLLYGDWKAGQVDDAYQVIPREWVRLAFKRWNEREKPRTPLTCAAIDASRGGKDKTVIAERYDNWFAPLRKFPGKSVQDGQAVMALLIDVPLGKDVPLYMDVIGIGSSPYDFAKEKYNAVPVNWSERSDARDKTERFGFVNKRAEHIWKMREALDPETGDNLALPDDPELLGDLCAARYAIRTNGIQVESKDEIKKRLGRSPDCGDAVCLALANANEAITDSFYYYGGRTQAEALGK